MAEVEEDAISQSEVALNLMPDHSVLDQIDEFIQENLEHEIVKAALREGVDLRQYSRQIEGDLAGLENESIKDYIAESQNIASLHRQIKSCDQILESMEGMLGGFQTALSSISAQIQTLQSQSIGMNQRLRNRQAVRGNLSQFLDEMVIPEQLINHILDTPVTEREFLEQLHELHHKIEFVKQQSFHETRSCHDVMDILNKLRIKSIEKSRDFLLQRIYQFRKPMTNYEIPQNALLKFRFYNEFLMAHERSVAKEVRDEYIDTASKMFASYFKSYASKLDKLQFEDMADKDDLIGRDDTNKRNTMFSSRPLRQRAAVFSLGQRARVLDELEGPVIVPHAVTKQRFPSEALFRSLHFALVENGCREYLFLTDFFMAADGQAATLFNTVMGKTIALLLKHEETWINESFDCIGLVLCLLIIKHYNTMCEERGCAVLNSYWQLIRQQIEQRFEVVMKTNIQSLREVEAQKLGNIDTRPHYIARRYAEFVGGLVSLNHTLNSARVRALLDELSIQVEGCLQRLGNELRGPSELIFLINNQDMILGVLLEHDTTEYSAEVARFRESLNILISQYVKALLSHQLGGIVKFVEQVEALVEQGNGDQCNQLSNHVAQLVKSFNENWKKAIEETNQQVMRSFVNFKNGTQIVQVALTQLIQYYHRFQKLLSQVPAFKNLSVRNDLVNLHQLMVEVKKYKPTF